MSRTRKSKNYLAGPKAVYSAKRRAGIRRQERDTLGRFKKGETPEDRRDLSSEPYFDHWEYD